MSRHQWIYNKSSTSNQKQTEENPKVKAGNRGSRPINFFLEGKKEGNKPSDTPPDKKKQSITPPNRQKSSNTPPNGKKSSNTQPKNNPRPTRRSLRSKVVKQDTLQIVSSSKVQSERQDSAADGPSVSKQSIAGALVENLNSSSDSDQDCPPDTGKSKPTPKKKSARHAKSKHARKRRSQEKPTHERFENFTITKKVDTIESVSQEDREIFSRNPGSFVVLDEVPKSQPVPEPKSQSDMVCKFKYMYQGSHHQGKTWETWKMVKAFFRPGKIREFEKRAKLREKSGNLKILSGKIREKIQRTMHALSCDDTEHEL